MADKGIPLEMLSPQAEQMASASTRAVAPRKRELDFNKLYFDSWTGRSSIVAMILAFLSMLIIEGHLGSNPRGVNSWGRDQWQVVFLEITALLSWFFQFLFIILTGILSVQNLFGLTERPMNFILIAHLTFWFCCVGASCLCIALATDYVPVAVSAVFGIFECLVLLITIAFATCQTKNFLEDPSFA